MDYAVIMAGGTGKRLWPLSRSNKPKQVLKLINGLTLLRCCYNRVSPVFEDKNILVLTNSRYVETVRNELPELPAENVIAEPAVRDTAGAIGLAAAILTKIDPEANMAVVTADQLIEPAEALQGVIKDAMSFVTQSPDKIITFGIKPDRPATGFGYIKCGPEANAQKLENSVYEVTDFKEKPDLLTAEKYLADGSYLWNAGMFVWKASTVLGHLEKFLPDATEPLRKIREGWGTENQDDILSEWFLKMPKISIDYAVMERAEGVHTIKLDCKWIDMGSFNALRLFTGSDTNNNVVTAGTSKLLESSNNIIVTEDKGHMIAAIGVEGLIIAHTPDATLICRADQDQRIKELLEMMDEKQKESFH